MLGNMIYALCNPTNLSMHIGWGKVLQPYFEGSVRMKLTFPKLGFWSPPRLSKFQSSIAGVKTPCIGMFFTSLESYWSVDVKNGLALAIWISVAQVMAKRKGGGSNWQFDSRPLKVGNRLDPSACKWSVTHHWKYLEESYKFDLDLIPIRGLSKELWSLKVLKVQMGTIVGFLLGSLWTKSHSDVGATERHKVYYVGEDGGFPQVRAVVSQVSLKLPMVCPSTIMWTNQLVGWFDAGSSNWIACHFFLVPSRSFSTPLYPF
jgi:hypothetical protein